MSWKRVRVTPDAKMDDAPSQQLRPRRARAVFAGVGLAACALAGVAATTSKACKHGQPCWSSRYDSFANMAAFPGGESAGPKAAATIGKGSQQLRH